ncbi:alpha/beta hydrolase family protein [Rhodococcus erythropolis]|uniref:alpha/beta hydrolase n=1 Tax=Rhodococcus erythropolis TaxID=1833 RepID=UPI00294A9369|nr:alpha/beta hydrolase family protein [Rhodococcus erythropolis]MDV6275892.1 alpha/beta hydrolase family protein [Rhodococcus erythropolis]
MLPKSVPHGRFRARKVMAGLGALLGVCFLSGVGITTVHADPTEPVAAVAGIRTVSDTLSVVDVFSPSMNRVISNEVLRPARGGSLPTLYLLNGALGNEDGVGWINNSTVRDFFADKNVTVVLPVGGRFSFYTDWQQPDPVLGVNNWQTYLTRELPAAIDAQFGGTGANAIAGLSMSGASALDLAIQTPGLYRATASLSGCPAPSNPLAAAGISTMIAGGLNNPFNMWGLPGSPAWREHDPSLNAAKLSGTAVYVAASRGNVGAVDRIPSGAMPPLGGMAVEAMIFQCTAQFVDALRAANIPATVSLREEGAHTWSLFEDELREAWSTTIAPALNTR